MRSQQADKLKFLTLVGFYDCATSNLARLTDCLASAQPLLPGMILLPHASHPALSLNLQCLPGASLCRCTTSSAFVLQAASMHLAVLYIDLGVTCGLCSKDHSKADMASSFYFVFHAVQSDVLP